MENRSKTYVHTTISTPHSNLPIVRHIRIKFYDIVAREKLSLFYLFYTSRIMDDTKNKCKKILYKLHALICVCSSFFFFITVYPAILSPVNFQILFIGWSRVGWHVGFLYKLHNPFNACGIFDRSQFQRGCRRSPVGNLSYWPLFRNYQVIGRSIYSPETNG